MKHIIIRDPQDSIVDAPSVCVGKLVFRMRKLDDELRTHTLKLSVLKKMHSRNGTSEHRDCRQMELAKCGGSSFFVVIFEEACGARLKFPVSFQVQDYIRNEAFPQPIVKTLV